MCLVKSLKANRSQISKIQEENVCAWSLSRVRFFAIPQTVRRTRKPDEFSKIQERETTW